MANIRLDQLPENLDDWAEDAEIFDKKSKNKSQPSDDSWDDMFDSETDVSKSRNRFRDIEDRLERRRLKREIFGDLDD